MLKNMRWKTLISILAFLILIVLVFNWLGVGGKRMIITEKGKTFSVSLESDPTISYDWQAEYNSEKLSLESKSFESKYPKKMDSSGIMKYTFEALDKGSVDITFTYNKQRGNEQVLEEKVYRVIVK